MSAVIDGPMEQVFHAALVKRGVPEHLHGGLLRYLCDGILPGHFLRAVLENNLTQAMMRADPVSREGLFNTTMFLYHYAPPESWGSHAKVMEWIKTFPKVQPMLEAMRGF